MRNIWCRPDIPVRSSSFADAADQYPTVELSAIKTICQMPKRFGLNEQILANPS
jgi:hypothetical protein